MRVTGTGTGTEQSTAGNDRVTVARFEIADQPVEGTNHRPVNRNSGKALAVGSTTDGGLAVQLSSGAAWTV